jgi:hypothetical protein
MKGDAAEPEECSDDRVPGGVLLGLLCALAWWAIGFALLLVEALSYTRMPLEPLGVGILLTGLIAGSIALVAWVRVSQAGAPAFVFILLSSLVGSATVWLFTIQLAQLQFTAQEPSQVQRLMAKRIPTLAPAGWKLKEAKLYKGSGAAVYTASMPWREVIHDLEARLPREWIRTALSPDSIAFASPLHNKKQDIVTVLEELEGTRIQISIGGGVLTLKDPSLLRYVDGSPVPPDRAHLYLRYPD